MKKYLMPFAVLPILCTVCAESISISSIPVEQLKKCLPEEWRIESIAGASSVPGWKTTSNSSNSQGVKIRIARTPYSNDLHQTKWGALEVHIPSVDLWIMPSAFEAEYIPLSDITFIKGNIDTTKVESEVAGVGILIVDDFTAVQNWYVFYVDKSFTDWKTPIADIVEVFKSTPNPVSHPADEVREESGKE